jgi:dephospho-CoA kinase
MLDVPVFDADKEAKEIVVKDSRVKSRLISVFGPETYTADGQLNRQHLATLAFKTPALNQEINSIVHPAVRQAYTSWHEVHKEMGCTYVINEAALLFEANRVKHMDKVLVVDAPEKLRVERIKQRDPYRDIEEIKAIIARQIPQREKVSKADFVIYNGMDSLLLPQIMKIHRSLLGQA